MYCIYFFNSCIVMKLTSSILDALLLFLSVSVSLLQLGDGGQRIFYLNNPGDYEQA